MGNSETNCMLTITNGEYDYKIIRSEVFIPEYGYTTTYGVSISGNDESAYVGDITDEFEKIRTFCELLCSEKACPVHLKNLVEDFLV